MKISKNYVYSNEKLSHQHSVICHQETVRKSDDETEQLLMKIKQVWNMNMSLEVLKFVFNEWQNHFDSERINCFCIELLKNEFYDKEWIKNWKRWLTAKDIPWIVSGTVAAYCLYSGELYKEWLLKNRINKNSRLGNEISKLYYCFCSAKDFNCSEDELLKYGMSMNEMQKERLLKNIFRRYIELEDNVLQENLKRCCNKTVKYLISSVKNAECRNIIGQALEIQEFECCV